MKNLRLLSALLAMLLLVTLIPSAALAESVEKTVDEIRAANKLDNTWAKLEVAEANMLANGANKAEVISAIFEAALNCDAVDNDSFSDFTGDGFFFTVDGMRCAYNYRLRNELTAVNDAPKGDTIIIKNDNAPKDAASLNALLVGPYYGYDENFTDQYIREISELGQALGGNAVILEGHDATGPAITNQFIDKGVVIFDSHGCSDAGSSYVCLTTKTGITINDYENGWAINAGSAAYINGLYIENHISEPASNTIVWMASCSGMQAESEGGTGYALLRAGCEVVYGYSQSVTFIGDYKYEEVFWDVMKDGGTVRDAAAKMKSVWGEHDPHGTAYPIFMSAVDEFPENPDIYQEVNSTYTLYGELPPVELEAISIDVSELNVNIGDCPVIEFNRTPYNANDFIVEWVSSDYNIISFYRGGKKNSTLIACGGGTAIITCNIYVDDQLFYSAPISVTVEFDESLMAANAEGSELSFGGSAIFPFMATQYDGQTCVCSSNYHNSHSESSLYLISHLNAGDTLSFDYYVSSQEEDLGIVKINNSIVVSESGTGNGWKSFSYTFPESDIYHISWTYAKDLTVSEGEDRMYVANVKIESAPTTETYTVTFVDGLNDDVIGTTTITDVVGGDFTLRPEHYPEPPVHDGYTFVDWDVHPGYYIQSDITITAQYVIDLLPGDANGDGVISIADASLIARMVLNLIDKVPAADFDGNGVINMADATLVARKALNLI